MLRGTICNISQKQKINIKSFTKTEVLSTDNCMPHMMWTKYFLYGQGYTYEYELQQNNTSAIRWDVNGKVSNDKRKKHTAIQYFFIKDRVDAGDITIHHCLTA